MFALSSLFRGCLTDRMVCLDYDLVRLYHPDKVIPSSASSLAADEAHARFQAITAAYDTLRGKVPLGDIASSATSGTAYPTTAAYRTMQRKRQELYEKGAVDDSRLDKWLIVGVVGVRLPRSSAQSDLIEFIYLFFFWRIKTVLFVVIHNLTTRRELIVEAVSRSRALASESRSRQIREAEARLSMDAVELVNNKAP